jgi:hypothetical protein
MGKLQAISKNLLFSRYTDPGQPDSPRFFVTLDGVDPDKLSQEAAMEVDEDFPRIAMLKSKGTNSNNTKTNIYRDPNAGVNTFRDPNVGVNTYRDPNAGMSMNVYREPNPVMKYRDTSAKNFNSDSEGEVEIENNTSPVKKTKMALMERCRFWPSCKNGAACPFHHPTTQCK